MKDKGLSFLLYKKASTNCCEKKMNNPTEERAKDMNRQFQEEKTQIVNIGKTAYPVY